MKNLISLTLLFTASLFFLTADEPFRENTDLNFAQVEYVRGEQEPDGTWTFSVRVRHKDEGWDHYANIWIIVDPESGDILGTRTLAHPHDNEQPFIRSLSKVVIPEGLEKVEVRAGCNRHGREGKRVTIDLSQPSSSDYEMKALPR